MKARIISITDGRDRVVLMVSVKMPRTDRDYEKALREIRPGKVEIKYLEEKK